MLNNTDNSETWAGGLIPGTHLVLVELQHAETFSESDLRSLSQATEESSGSGGFIV